VTEKNKWPCPGDPEALKGMPIGMYHCEFCGEMQLAGVPHLPPQFPEQWEEPFPKIEEQPFPKIEEPEPPPLAEVLKKLEFVAAAEDCAEVRFYLEEIMTEYPEADRQAVWAALDERRDDPEAKYILKHLNMTKGTTGSWTVALHDDICCEEED
jgi:hypothetical protein